MPRYYCDYCDVFLTHDSMAVRKVRKASFFFPEGSALFKACSGMSEQAPRGAASLLEGSSGDLHLFMSFFLLLFFFFFFSLFSFLQAHGLGRKHKSAVRDYYGQFEENVVQAIIDTRIREYEAREAAIQSGLLPQNAPFSSCMPPHPLAPGVSPSLPPGWESGTPSPVPQLTAPPAFLTGATAFQHMPPMPPMGTVNMPPGMQMMPPMGPGVRFFYYLLLFFSFFFPFI
jgi:hypothetical protein